jgi:adenylate kinase family enzyme
VARVHILGAPGSGTSTLGSALAADRGWPLLDADFFYWEQTDPPFQRAREPAARDALFRPLVEDQPDWVFAGSALGWARPWVPLYDLVVFLRVDPAIRMARLHARETARHGGRIAPGGDMHTASVEFLEWAERYDTAGHEQRSLIAHEAWLDTLQVPVLRLDSAAPVPALLRSVQLALPRVQRGEGPRP